MITSAFDKFELAQTNQKKSMEAFLAYPETFHLSIQSRTAAIDTIVLLCQRRITQFCQSHQIPRVNISVCLREALANAIIHGNLEISSTLKEDSWKEFEALVQERETSPEFAERQITIRCQMTVKQLRLEVEDQGQGFDASGWQTCKPTSRANYNPLSSALFKSGRGLLIITSLMDSVFWNETGNRITMIKNFQIS
jgi:anti-sigma regulatory factor (Ser/Thr protein kinase)